MKKSLFIIIFLVQCVFAQTSKINIKNVIQNTKTEKHMNITGTRLHIIPPPEFKLANMFIGLEKKEKLLLMYTI